MSIFKAFTLIGSLLLLFTLGGCASKKRATQQDTAAMNTTEINAHQMPIGFGGRGAQQLAPIVIYKTRSNYNKMVPVMLGADGAIVSYPSRGDLGSGDRYFYPIELTDGYLWDRRGVGLTTAFLSLSYEEYSAFPADPTAAELQNYIMDRSPFTFLAVCDRSQLKEITPEELNRYIASGMPGANILIKE
ncbi:hypothetical protein [Porphyromonas circumdentaria]|uniref:Lipoprotein n=1 Tax=Porphyromonas circumdentaria TaxID=29524 RepID=A0A1T4L346_9PORP|nr:hypothetical protein [Porphyromonas circumdentaria]MBB6275201.1 hypothetical protein [Porphyromonas circumdentaria]MDO4721831.1 hypothetical protein [Porphyromonas circumdentaria]SJZ48957.1 hypothetical protein SAMN02745171_00283 [Porphyromonas circumdentaria]